MDGVASSETESIPVQNLLAHGQRASQRNFQSNGQETEVQGSRDGQGRRFNPHANHEVPMPRQALFDGKTTWESFFSNHSKLWRMLDSGITMNKSTASGAIYARSSVIFPRRMAFVRGRLMQ